MSAGDSLAKLDALLAAIEQQAFPNPIVIRKAIAAARDTLAEVIQDIEELTARIGLMEEEKNGENR